MESNNTLQITYIKITPVPKKRSKCLWLGKWFLFQTFNELDYVKDKLADANEIRQLLDEEDE